MISEDFLRDFFSLRPRKPKGGLDALIGKRCGIIFDLSYNEWPISGTPAWAYVLEIDRPLMRLGSFLEDKGEWVNLSCIQKIWE